MPAKRKKDISSTSWPRRVYTTRKITEMTQQRRLEEDAAREQASRREAESKIEIQENRLAPIVEDPKPALSLPVTEFFPVIKIKTFSPELTHPTFKEEDFTVKKSKDYTPIDASIVGYVGLGVITFFLVVSSKFVESWVNALALAAKINTLIIDGSSFVLNVIQGACAVQGAVLYTNYYKISLQGDSVALYSLELVIFVALFSFFQKTSWIKRGVAFISMIPLVIMANVLRVVVAFGLALNDGAAYADQYFYGVLAGSVFIFVALGLMCFEFLFP